MSLWMRQRIIFPLLFVEEIMGRECFANSFLVYGVVLETPYSPDWPFFLKRLQSVHQAAEEEEATRAAVAKPNTGDEDEDDEPPAKVARRTKSFLRDIADATDDEDGNGHDDEFENQQYLLDDRRRKEFTDAVQGAFDKMLGQDHGLSIQAYFGCNEDETRLKLVLQSLLPDISSGDVSMFQMCSTKQVVLPGVMDNKEKIDLDIHKVLSMMDLKVEADNSNKKESEGTSVQPGWVLVTTCQFYP